MVFFSLVYDKVEDMILILENILKYDVTYIIIRV